jgi:DNA-binding PadR family transcriptional regulator
MNWTTLQLRKGLTTLIVLDALEEGAWYAYGLRRAVHERTRGLFQFSEGALYPLLHTLRARGLVSVRPRKVHGRVRLYYALTAKGQQSLDEFRREWSVLQNAMTQVLRPASAGHRR